MGMRTVWGIVGLIGFIATVRFAGMREILKRKEIITAEDTDQLK